MPAEGFEGGHRLQVDRNLLAVVVRRAAMLDGDVQARQARDGARGVVVPWLCGKVFSIKADDAASSQWRPCAIIFNN